MRLVLLLILLVSCGQPEDNQTITIPFIREALPEIEIHEELQPYLDDFLEDAEYYGTSLDNLPDLRIITFAKLKTKQKAGVCRKYVWEDGSVAYLKIQISNKYKYDYSYRVKGLMYHELGHCLLGEPHTEKDPAAIMNPSLSNSEYYEDNWDSLVEELFTDTVR